MEYIRRHKRIVLIGLIVLAVFTVIFGFQRKRVMEQSVEDELKDEPREETVKSAEFYLDQLTKKEMEVYLFLKDQIEQFQGGILTLPKAVNGKEYERITVALEYEGYNYFYGFVDIPMNEDNVYLLNDEKDFSKITEDEITKVVLFLSCASGIETPGEIADDGTLKNAEEIQKGLSVNDEEKIVKIKEKQEETERVLSEIIDGIPENSGQKSTVDYFLKWLDQEMKVPDDTATTASELSHMGEMLEQVYLQNHLVAVTEKKASVLGYAKIFSELCRRAGMDSHVVMGHWNGKWSQDEQYVLCAVKIGDQTVYVDASGAKGSSLAGHRYLSEKEAKNRLTFADCFQYD